MSASGSRMPRRNLDAWVRIWRRLRAPAARGDLTSAESRIVDLARNFSRVEPEFDGSSSNFPGRPPKLPENAAKQAHHAAQVGIRGHEAAEEDAERLAVGRTEAAG